MRYSWTSGDLELACQKPEPHSSFRDHRVSHFCVVTCIGTLFFFSPLLSCFLFPFLC